MFLGTEAGDLLGTEADAVLVTEDFAEFDPPGLDVVIDGTTARLSHDPSPMHT